MTDELTPREKLLGEDENLARHRRGWAPLTHTYCGRCGHHMLASEAVGRDEAGPLCVECERQPVHPYQVQ